MATQIIADPKIPSVWYTDLTATVKVSGMSGIKSDVELFGTVNNRFNKAPPFVPSRFIPGLAVPTPNGDHDIFGRMFMIGARAKT